MQYAITATTSYESAYLAMCLYRRNQRLIVITSTNTRHLDRNAGGACSNLQYSINSFTILRKCNSDYETKIHEALLIKRYSPGLNKQCYARGASFLLNIYSFTSLTRTAGGKGVRVSRLSDLTNDL